MDKEMISKNLTLIKDNIDYISSAIEIVANSCIYNEKFSEYDVLKDVLQRSYKIFENIDDVLTELEI